MRQLQIPYPSNYIDAITPGLVIALNNGAPRVADVGGVHIWEGTAGAVIAAANSLLILESNQTTHYLQFLGPTNTTAQGIYFGDTTNDVGGLLYSHSANSLTFRMAGGNRLVYSAGAFAFQEATTISTTTGDLTVAPAGGLILQNATTDTLSFFGVTAVDQETGIVNADGTLADITTKFNTLLGSLEAYGLLAVA